MNSQCPPALRNSSYYLTMTEYHPWFINNDYITLVSADWQPQSTTVGIAVSSDYPKDHTDSSCWSVPAHPQMTRLNIITQEVISLLKLLEKRKTESLSDLELWGTVCADMKWIIDIFGKSLRMPGTEGQARSSERGWAGSQLDAPRDGDQRCLSCRSAGPTNMYY